MIDVNKKLDKIEKSCCEIAKKENSFLKEENDNIISEKVLEKVNLYKEELAKKYISEMNKIERDYNRNLFDYEINERIKINDFKQILKDSINSKVENELLIFVNSFEYKDYLFKIINKTLEKIEANEHTKIYVTEHDFDRFKEDIKNTFFLEVDKISNENIGGCVIINSINKVSINNTLKTNIEEKIKKISL